MTPFSSPKITQLRRKPTNNVDYKLKLFFPISWHPDSNSPHSSI